MQLRAQCGAGNMIFDETETDQLAGARYWPKMGCDKDGNNCLLGGSGGPGQHCAPPSSGNFAPFCVPQPKIGSHALGLERAQERLLAVPAANRHKIRGTASKPFLRHPGNISLCGLGHLGQEGQWLRSTFYF